MKTFKINDKVEIVCEWKKTRTAFKHVATLLEDGREVDSTKICYQNRTWEKFTFESVIELLLDKTKYLEGNERAEFLERCENGEMAEVKKMFGGIATITKLGEVLCDDQKSKNDFKVRMLKAGLGDKGLEMPSDWDELSEEEKEKRLNSAIAEIA